MRPAPVIVDATLQPLDRWDVPARGSIGWRTLLSKGLTASDSIVCGVAELAPGQDFAAHHHPQAEVYFGLEGVGVVVVDGAPCRLAPGVALFIPGGAVHGVPTVAEALRWFYVFAADSFDDIAYSFLPTGDQVTSAA